MDTYKRLLNYVKPHIVRLTIAILCMFGYSVTVALASAIPYLAIGGISNKNEIVISSETFPHLPFEFDLRFPVFWIPIFIVAVVFLRGIFEYISRIQMANVGISIVRKIRDDLYEHLVHLSSDFYSKGKTGDFLSRITNDVKNIQGGVTDVLTDIVKQPLTIIVLIPSVFIWGGPPGIIAILVLPIVAVPIAILGQSLRRAAKKMQERTADITSFIGETLTGIHIVKAFNQEQTEIDRFKEINKGVFNYFKKMIKVTIVQRPLIEMMAAVGAGLAIWVSIDNFTPEKFTSYVAALFLLYEPLKKLSKVNNSIQKAIAGGARIFEIMDAEPTIKNAEGAIEFDEKIEEVRFENASFAYGDTPVLNNISLSAKWGEVIALVGSSGGGKTTLVNLIPRFYDPGSGKISMNGKDIRDFTLHSLRSKIAMVSQDTVLFNGSIKQNIAYHDGDGEISLERVKMAAEAAHASGFIESLSEGYETEIGERGMKLSGGQRQRLSIARAIYKDPPILILDEATSHLDTESEREVQAAIDNLLSGRTVFVIAHRLSTIQNATRILVLDHGEIIQQGTHESLLKEGGAYKRLYDLQFEMR